MEQRVSRSCPDIPPIFTEDADDLASELGSTPPSSNPTSPNLNTEFEYGLPGPVSEFSDGEESSNSFSDHEPAGIPLIAYSWSEGSPP